jgi:hypothetical protein
LCHSIESKDPTSCTWGLLNHKDSLSKGAQTNIGVNHWSSSLLPKFYVDRNHCCDPDCRQSFCRNLGFMSSTFVKSDLRMHQKASKVYLLSALRSAWSHIELTLALRYDSLVSRQSSSLIHSRRQMFEITSNPAHGQLPFASCSIWTQQNRPMRVLQTVLRSLSPRRHEIPIATMK